MRAVVVAVGLSSFAAFGAPDLGVRLEPHVLLPLSQPQASYFGAGFAGRATVMLEPLALARVAVVRQRVAGAPQDARGAW